MYHDQENSGTLASSMDTIKSLQLDYLLCLGLTLYFPCVSCEQGREFGAIESQA